MFENGVGHLAATMYSTVPVLFLCDFGYVSFRGFLVSRLVDYTSEKGVPSLVLYYANAGCHNGQTNSPHYFCLPIPEPEGYSAPVWAQRDHTRRKKRGRGGTDRSEVGSEKEWDEGRQRRAGGEEEEG